MSELPTAWCPVCRQHRHYDILPNRAPTMFSIPDMAVCTHCGQILDIEASA